MKKQASMLLLFGLCLLFLAAACRANSSVAVPPAAETTPQSIAPVEANATPEIDTVTVTGTEDYELVPPPTAIPPETPTPTPTEVPITDPVITLFGGENYQVTADFTFTDPGFSAVDYLGNNLTDRVTVKGEVTAYLVGSYDLSYTVTDDGGRSTTAVRRVEVVAAELPEIVMPPEKTVYLTFDDGPCSYTEKLLDVLQKYDAKATFFVVGNKSRKDLIARAYQEGHSIGVHSYTHVYKEIYKSEKAFFEDFQKTQEVIKEQTGSYTRIFRFPGGSANTVSHINKGIMTRLTKIMEDMGYRYFDWNVSSGDASSGYTQDSVKKNVINGMKNPTDFVIILQHDIHLPSVRAVEAILQWGQKNGYTFAALDLTSPIVHSKVQN